MRLTRLYVEAALAAGSRVVLAAAVATHVVRVLRMQSGAQLSLFDGHGHEHAATIASAKGTRVEIEIGAALVPIAESRLAITLAQGIARSERMDFAIQKATELGVAHIVPLLTERSIVKLDARQAESRRQHWQGVVIAACEQCGRATLPRLDPPRPLLDYLAALLDAPDPPPLRAVLVPEAEEGFGTLPASLGAIELLIGPEGGFADEELALALRAGFRRRRLGTRILRTETAAAAALAALQALRGDLL